MRTTTALLLLLGATAFAQEPEDLVYRAQWAELTTEKLGEALALYERVLKEHPDSAVAPRAHLGVLRIRAVRGDDISADVEAFAKKYPGASELHALARKLVRRLAFDPKHLDTDTPIDTKLKEIYAELSDGDWPDDDDETFLLDLGARAHPMLARLLRSTDSESAKAAASLLCRQRDPAAWRVLAEALRDPNALFKSSICAAIQENEGRIPAAFVDALERLRAKSPPRFRAQIAAAFAAAAGYGGEAEGRIWTILTALLSDPDPAVRAAAAAPDFRDYDAVPDAYVAKLLVVLGDDDTPVPAKMLGYLHHFAHRPGVFDAALKQAVEYRSPTEWQGAPARPEGAMLVARYGVARDSGYTRERAVGWSAEAAAWLLRSGIERDHAQTVDDVHDKWGELSARYASIDAYLGADAAVALRRFALERSYDGKAAAAGRALIFLGYDLDLVREVARDGKGVPPAVLGSLRSLGAKDAAALAPLLAPEQVAGYLRMGNPAFASANVVNRRDFVDPDWLGAVLSVARPEHLALVGELAVTDPARTRIGRWLVEDATDPAWGWTTPDHRPAARPGFLLQMGSWFPPDALLERLDDPRAEIAIKALDELPRATRAQYERVLRSPWWNIRLKALRSWPAQHAELLVPFLQRTDLHPQEREIAFTRLAEGDAAHAPAVRAFLETRKEPAAEFAWGAYVALAPKAATEFALAEAVGAGGADHRHGALVALASVRDERRLAVFRTVLRTGEAALVDHVLHVVGEQYLIELSDEILEMLRHPSDAVRKTAAATIERLKYYVEARRVLKKELSGSTGSGAK